MKINKKIINNKIIKTNITIKITASILDLQVLK